MECWCLLGVASCSGNPISQQLVTLTEAFGNFSRSLQGNSGTVLQIRPRPLPCNSFPNHLPQNIPTFDPMQSGCLPCLTISHEENSWIQTAWSKVALDKLHWTTFPSYSLLPNGKGNLYRFLKLLGPPLWSSGQSSCLQIQRSGFDSRRYQIFCEVVGLERGPLSLVSTIEELLERKSSGSGLESRDYDRRGSAALTTRHPSIRKSWH
jgi:hypothetical protein